MLATIIKSTLLGLTLGGAVAFAASSAMPNGRSDMIASQAPLRGPIIPSAIAFFQRVGG